MDEVKKKKSRCEQRQQADMVTFTPGKKREKSNKKKHHLSKVSTNKRGDGAMKKGEKTNAKENRDQ